MTFGNQRFDLVQRVESFGEDGGGRAVEGLYFGAPQLNSLNFDWVWNNSSQ